jgi:hypothetical protein
MNVTDRAMASEEWAEIERLRAENDRLSRRILKLERAVCGVAVIDDFYGPGGRMAKAEAALATDEEGRT